MVIMIVAKVVKLSWLD